jgi:hypothetical protein
MPLRLESRRALQQHLQAKRTDHRRQGRGVLERRCWSEPEQGSRAATPAAVEVLRQIGPRLSQILRAGDTLARLETMSMMSDVEMPLIAMRAQIASAVQVIVQVSRVQDGTRKITHITEVRGFDPQAARYDLQDVFVRRFEGVDDQGRVKSQLKPSGQLPSFLPQLHQHGVDLPSAVHDAARKESQMRS